MMGLEIATDGIDAAPDATEGISPRSALTVCLGTGSIATKGNDQVSFSPDALTSSEESARSSPSITVYSPDSDGSAKTGGSLEYKHSDESAAPLSIYSHKTATPYTLPRSLSTRTQASSSSAVLRKWRKVAFTQPHGRIAQLHVLDLAIAPSVSAVWAHDGAPAASDGLYYPLGPQSVVYFEGEPEEWLKDGFIPDSDPDGMTIDADAMLESMRTIWRGEQILRRMTEHVAATSGVVEQLRRRIGEEDRLCRKDGKGDSQDPSSHSKVDNGAVDLGTSPLDYWGPPRVIFGCWVAKASDH